MKILVPMHYFTSGSIQTVIGDNSHFELGGSDLMPKASPSEGEVGLWELEYHGDDLMPSNTPNLIDDYFIYDSFGDITTKLTITDAIFDNLILSMSVATSSTFEPRKAFTGDLGEYAKIKDFLMMKCPYTSVGTQGLLIKSETILDGSTKQIVLQEYSGSNRSGFVNVTPTNVWGNGTISGDAIKDDSNPTDILILIEYPNDDTWKYYAVSSSTAEYDNVNNIVHGILYDVGSGHRVEQQSYNYNYPQSKVQHSSLGNVNWSGWANNNIKRNHTLELQSVSEETRDVFLDIFKLGKGGLPIWFIDNEDDNDTWMLISIPTMTVTEPHPGGFNITMNLKEF